MAVLIPHDRIKETSTTVGTAAYDLAGAEDGFQTFSSHYGNTDQLVYCAVEGADFEVGIGTLTTGTPDSLSRDSILSSSNSDAAVNWGAGTRKLFVTIPAKWYQHFSFGFSGTAIVAAQAAGTDGMAIGVDSSAGGNDSIAAGSHSNATALQSIAISNSDATAESAIAVGWNASAGGADSIAIGTTATASTAGSIGIGDDADATGLNAIHITSGGTSSAAGEKGVSIGHGPEAEGLYAVGIGYNCQAFNDQTVAIGSQSNAYATGAVALGASLTSNEQYGVALGTNFHNRIAGSQSFGIESDAGWYDVCIEADTTDGTAADMTTKGGGVMSLDEFGSDRTWSMKGIICARQTGGTAGAAGDSAAFFIDALIKVVAGTTTLVGSTATAADHADAAFGGSVAISADDTNNNLVITVTGELDKTIHWVGKITLVEAW